MKYFLDMIMKCPVWLAVLMILTVMHTAEAEGRVLQEEIADKVIRFHVRANSDTQEDQELKLCVRDAVMEELEKSLSQDADIDSTREELLEYIPLICETARQVIFDKGYEYAVKVYLTKEYFPVRKYGDVVLPPGEYEALRVDIGKAEGKNWWCILYPAMCFVETTHAVYDYDADQKLQEVFTQEEYEYVTDYTIRFKYLTFLNP
jgi:stage II sporulation protein R